MRLSQKGRSHWACCPFHHEKTPSFTVSKNSQIFKCFGCGKGGDVFSFVMEFERMTFIEAVKLLADKAGLKVPQNVGADEAKQAEIVSKKEQMYKITLAAVKHYHENLRSAQGQKARDYLSKRGFTPKTMVKFGLGVSLGYGQLVKCLKEQKLNLDVAVEAAVLTKRGGVYSDALANRLIVPIFNAQSQVVGFGGRSLVQTDFGKYKNTGTSLIFDKSRTLYAINFVKKLKNTGGLKNVIIVEGYMDTIALSQAGIENCVASMGTSLTQQQAQLLKRYTEDVFICYDGDSAGQNATLRGLDILKSEGLNVKVVTLPKGLDPDDVVKASGADGFAKLFEEALPLVDYKLNILKAKHKISNGSDSNSREAMTKYLSDAGEVLGELEEIEREAYVKLLSRESGYTDAFIRQISQTKVSSERVKTIESVLLTTDAESKARYFLTSCLLFNKEFDKINENVLLSEDAFLNCVLQYIAGCKLKGIKPDPSEVYRLSDADNRKKEIDVLLSFEFSDANVNKQYFTDSVNLLTKLIVEKELAHANEAYSQAANDAQKKEALEKIKELSQKLRQCK